MTKKMMALFVALFVFASACSHTYVDLGPCRTNADCADGNVCTIDVCDVDHACIQIQSDSPACDPEPECVPVIEVCNGADDDCDGETDEGCEEICNGLDDDGDNAVDEGCPCENGDTPYRGCGYGPPPANYCALGTQYCNPDGVITECIGAFEPGAESCDFPVPVDTDCDGLFTYEDPDCESACRTDTDCAHFDGECLVFRCLANSCFAYERDDDGDGRSLCGGLPEGEHYDCDDHNPAIHPGATEICDEMDNDCDGETDEGVTETRYRDEDGDGYGDPELSAIVCHDDPPVEGVLVAGDCDDRNPTVHPDATEICDSGIDNDCDGNTDEGLLIMYYLDADGDGYGDPGWLVGYTCYDSALSNWAPNRGDCDDSDPTVHPGAGCPPCEVTYYQDWDGDGYGNRVSGRAFSCDDNSVVGYITTIGDCDDRFSSAHAGASEICDGYVDEDCDTVVDEDCP